MSLFLIFSIIALGFASDGFADKTQDVLAENVRVQDRAEESCFFSDKGRQILANNKQTLANSNISANKSPNLQSTSQSISLPPSQSTLHPSSQPKSKKAETGTKKFSIIIPIYNTEKYLPECIESVINQSYRNLEIILVNDGSPGNADEICRKYSQLDSRIKYIKQDNQGVAIARNNGIATSSGDYIFCADSDDTLESAFIEKVNKVFEKESSDCVIIGESCCREPVELMGARPTCAVAVTKEFLDKYPDVRFQEHMQPCEDGLFTHKLLALTDKISLCKSAKYFYRQHSESSEHNLSTQKMLRDIPKWFDILEDFYTKYNLWNKRNKKLHLLAFINAEPFGRYHLLPFSVRERYHLFYLMHKFMKKHDLNDAEIAKRLPRGFSRFVMTDSFFFYEFKRITNIDIIMDMFVDMLKYCFREVFPFSDWNDEKS